MTVHFHTKHYQESGLNFPHYMMILFYELKQNWKVKELEVLFTLSERKIIRLRQDLVRDGYLERVSFKVYKLTDKLYKKETRV